MFGVLRGASCGLPQQQRDQWMNHICGVCLALRDQGGQAARLCTNYDAALISVLCEAQTAEPLALQTSTCALRGQRRFSTAVIAPTNPAAQYAATLALSAGATKIADHVADGDGWWGWMRPWANWLSRRWQKIGQGMGQPLGFDTHHLTQQVAHQPAREAAVGQNFLFYAEPTELAVGAAFAHTAVLSGRPHNAPILQEIGRLFGRIMYLLDSYTDYAADQQGGQFNALAASYPQADKQTLAAEAQALFQTSYRALKTAFFQLDLAQPALARQLLIHQLKRRGTRLLGLGTAVCASCAAATWEDGDGMEGKGEEQNPKKKRPQSNIEDNSSCGDGCCYSSHGGHYNSGCDGCCHCGHGCGSCRNHDGDGADGCCGCDGCDGCCCGCGGCDSCGGCGGCDGCDGCCCGCDGCCCDGCDGCDCGG